MRILAIDPGFERLGIAVIERKNRSVKEELIYSSCFKTSAKLSISERFFLIGQEVASKIKKFRPDVLAIETIFLTSNQKTAIAVAEARGVVIYECERAHLKIFEYSPLQIKQAVTGYGAATKEQVAKMVKNLIFYVGQKKSDDEIDAIAIGLTCFARERFS